MIMKIKIASLALAISLASNGQQILISQSAQGGTPEAPALVGIASSGIDPDGRIGHIQGITQVSGPAPAGTSSPIVVQGAVAGSSVSYTCDPTVTAVPGVCTTLNTTIASLYTSRFTNVNASIYVRFGTTGLGQSTYLINTVTYTNFRNALKADLSDANDATAFNSNVPATNPINSSDSVWLTNGNARALGFTANTGLEADAATLCTIGTTGCYDGIVTVSSTEQAGGHLFFRSGPITSSQYDFFTVVEHETDEILGTPSCAFPACGGSTAIFPSDLYRYSSNATRSFAPGNNNPCSASNSGNACFSIDGVHMLQQYNNLNNGDDAGDWLMNCANPLVQDATMCSGVGGIDISPSAEILVLDVIGYNLVALEPTGVSPASGSGSTQTFTYTFEAPNGWQSLSVVDMLINNSLDGIGACYVAVIPTGAAAGSVLLVDDAGDAGGPFATLSLPGAGTIQNSQCSITGTGSSLSANGTTLTVILVITFKASFAGTKITYMAVQNTSSVSSGWQALGVWTVPGTVPAGPAVGGVSPGHSSSTNQTYTFTFTDTNGFADIAVANILIDNFLNGIGSCYIAFTPSSPTSGSVLLVDDAGDAGGPFAIATLPGTGTAQNSQCSISGTGSSVSSSGNTLTLVLNMTFKPAFSGNKVLYMATRSNSLSSGWQSMGTVDVP
jgi:hypothetical protein